jgi:hypothetical protein
MDTICLSDIKNIMRQGSGAHVSIFMPTHHHGGANPQDPIRFKKLLRLAEQKLIAKGMRPTEAKVLLNPAEGLTTNNLFWRQQSEGLAIFLDRNKWMYYRVPSNLNEEVGAGDRFFIKPLLPLLSDCGVYYVLAVSQHDRRLLQCTSAGSTGINLAGLPKNMDEALHLEVSDRPMQHHAAAPAGGSDTGSGASIQFGEVSRQDILKKNILQYLDIINKGIMKVLKDERAPLVLAAVEDMQPLYRTANSYHNLLPESILGNPDGVSDKILCDQAWSIVKIYFEQTKKQALADYLKTAGTGLTAAGIENVLPVADHGQVRFLFLAESAQHWGIYDSETTKVTVHTTAQSEEEDLVDLAAFQTLSHSGTIYIMKDSEMPAGVTIASTLRFS